VRDDDADAFVSELKHWRDVRGLSQTAKAQAMGYHRTYLSKIENGQEQVTRDFAARAEEVLKAGGALARAFRETSSRRRSDAVPRPPVVLEHDDETGSLVVEHDHAKLYFDGTNYRTTQRRQLFNGGQEPIAGYLIRISVDRFPGSPELSNQLYREDPLTWEELDLRAVHGDSEPMTWRVKHDRDAFKELWLLFENAEGRFPLYPGESAVIEYSYTVAASKWGPWFQRAVRLPTHRLSVELDFPTDLDPAVWGTETTMTAAALPLRTAIRRSAGGDRSVYSWSTSEPPLHARYRLEWKFRARPDSPEGEQMPALTPSQAMREIGIVQDDDPLLRRLARPFDLPAEAEDARRVVAQLRSTMDRVAAAHTFSKGMGLAAPQIGIDRAVAIVRPPDGAETLTLINPVVVEESTSTDERYEGCLSFFDVRGCVPRPLVLNVEHQDVDGALHITCFERGMARLVAHEIDHLAGQLYTDKMRPGVEPIPVDEYRGTGQTWRY